MKGRFMRVYFVRRGAIRKPVHGFCGQGMTLGSEPKPEPSAVSAIVKDELGRPYPGVTVAAILEESGSIIAQSKTDEKGRVKFDVPSSGVSILLMPKPGLFYKSIPESARVESLPTSGFLRDKWGWDESATFKVLPMKFEDYLTLQNIVIGVAAIAAIWWFFIRQD